MVSETADDCASIIGASGRWRVIRCADDLQWIVQHRKPGHAKRPWRAVAYVFNPDNLPGVIERPSMGIPPDNLEAILSEWQGRRAAGTARGCHPAPEVATPLCATLDRAAGCLIGERP